MLVKEDDGTWEAEVEEESPTTVLIKHRLRDDLACITRFLASPTPPTQSIRGREKSNGVASVVYGFMDAAKYGFGDAFDQPGQDLQFNFGLWKASIATEKRSNYKELRNLVEALERFLATPTLEELKGLTIFLFTDNTVTEQAFFKGNSTNKYLFELVYRLHMLQVDFGIHLHVVHIAGTRMITAGVDGLSRGCVTEGVMMGSGGLLPYVPLHLSVLSRSPDLQTWINWWWPEDSCGNLEVLDANGWFVNGHRPGSFVWAPPPAIARDMFDELGSARHKRPDKALHIVVVPRLMTALWRKHLGKMADLLITIPCSESSIWCNAQHEPVLLAICFPLVSFRPWTLRNTLLLLDAVW